MSRDAMLGHIRDVVAATPLPLNADFESGYASEPEGVAENVGLCIGTGVAGLSIEDATGDDAVPLHEISAARGIAEEGSFDALRDATPFNELNNVFGK